MKTLETPTTSASASAPPAIAVRDVYKSYRRGTTSTPVLQGIKFEVTSGECVFLVGPSGSGKSTLLSILGCILTPDQGTVSILGNDLGSLSNQQRTILRRDRLGFVFQKIHLIRGLSSLDNVCVPLTLRGVTGRAAKQRGRELLEAVGLEGKANSMPQNMSTGQCQRVALARALAVNPALILADEPTASLDAENGQQVMKLLMRLTTEEGKSVVVVTHDHRILPFADRVCHLENGHVVDVSTKDQARALIAC